MTTAADTYEDLARKHYRTITLILQPQADGSITYYVGREGRVPAKVSDVEPKPISRSELCDPAAVSVLENLIDTLVIPADAAALHLNVAP